MSMAPSATIIDQAGQTLRRLIEISRSVVSELDVEVVLRPVALPSYVAVITLRGEHDLGIQHHARCKGRDYELEVYVEAERWGVFPDSLHDVCA